MSGEGRRLASSGLRDYGSAEAGDKLAHCGNSIFLTAGIIVADVVGAGILSMAVAIAKFGWLLGTVMTIILLGMNVHISIIVWRVRMKCPGARTYVELAEAAFAGAPAIQQKLAKYATGISQQVLIAGFLGVYTLSLGKGFGMMFYDVHFCLPMWTLLGCALILPIVCSARQLGTWKSLIWLNCITILLTVIIPLVVMANQGLESSRVPGSKVVAVADFSLSGWSTGLNIMIFSFTSQFMLVEIMSEMKDPAEFRNSYLFISAPFQGIAFLICGLGGYYFRGDLVAGIIADNIPFGFWFRVTAGCLLIHMIITWVIKGIVFCRALLNAAHSSIADDASSRGWAVWVGTVTATVAVSYLIAQIVPFFVDLIDILGASLTPFVCFVVPIAFYVRWLRDFGKDEDRISYFEWAIIVVEVTLAVVMLFAGTYLAASNIISSWKEYGYPFACHCQNLWDTCSCSGDHPGMEHCKTQ